MIGFTARLFFILVLLSSSVFGQYSSAQIDSLVQLSLKKFNVAGVALGLVKDGKVIHTRGYGVKSVDSNLPVNKHTNFAIASNSKAFTTAALSILVDDGKLKWKPIFQ